jgi:hypothetical protein
MSLQRLRLHSHLHLLCCSSWYVLLSAPPPNPPCICTATTHLPRLVLLAFVEAVTAL